MDATTEARRNELAEALCTFGDACKTPDTWRSGEPDYVAELSLTPADLPQLIETAKLWVDDAYWRRWQNEPDDNLRVYAPVHAWRAISQLKAGEAAYAMVGLLRPLAQQDSDWLTEEFDHVIGSLGGAAIKPLSMILLRGSDAEILEHEETGEVIEFDDEFEYARVTAASALKCLAKLYPEQRGEVVKLLAKKLGLCADDSPTVNGFVVAALLDLEAVEAEYLIEHAYRGQHVDRMVVGGWETVRHELTGAPLDADKATAAVGESRVERRHDEQRRRREKRKRQRRNKKSRT